jgi:hypothetical protein
VNNRVPNEGQIGHCVEDRASLVGKWREAGYGPEAPPEELSLALEGHRNPSVGVPAASPMIDRRDYLSPEPRSDHQHRDCQVDVVRTPHPPSFLYFCTQNC